MQEKCPYIRQSNSESECMWKEWLHKKDIACNSGEHTTCKLFLEAEEYHNVCEEEMYEYYEYVKQEAGLY